MAKDSNSRMDDVARRAREVEERKVEGKFDAFQRQVKNYHEKLILRQQKLDQKQN